LQVAQHHNSTQHKSSWVCEVLQAIEHHSIKLKTMKSYTNKLNERHGLETMRFQEILTWSRDHEIPRNFNSYM
jgi:hypothetical protein